MAEKHAFHHIRHSEHLHFTIVRTENSVLAMKIPFSDDAAPISSSN
jgi:uncharacterized hydantoinase/oxoprolinase family protein